MLLALLLYVRRPRAYLTFALWCWLLTPLLRRFVDYAIGWQEPNFVLLTPLLVSCVSAVALVRPNKPHPLNLPPVILFAMAGILYGFFIGLLLHPSGELIYGLVNWTAPILLGMHMVVQWRDYEWMKQWVGQQSTWAASLLGAYGVYQYMTSPPWDTYWLEQITGGLIDPSFGTAERFGIRVWSTLNSPGPFANTMVASLLLLFVSQSRWKLPAAAAGYASLLLSAVRTAWLSWIVALGLFLRRAKAKTVSRMLISIAAIALLVLPLILRPEIAPALGDRLKTFTRLHNDESFNERQQMYRVVGGIILHDPFGHGLRNTEIVNNIVVDSGILVMLLSLGWLGVALYGVGLLSFVFRRGRARHDDLSRMAEAICLAFLVQLVGGPVFNGVTGAVFWICLGLSMAADRWHAHETARGVTAAAAASELPGAFVSKLLR